MAKGDYRRDTRSEKEFADHIKASTQIEAVLMKVYVEDLSRRTGKAYSIEDHGIDNTGEYIADAAKVNTKADFWLVTHDGKRRRIEIKYSKPANRDFHLKESQLISYKKQDCCIVMFSGIATDDPKYTIIKPTLFDNILEGKQIWMWGKPQRKLLVKDFTWYSVKLPKFKC